MGSRNHMGSRKPPPNRMGSRNHTGNHMGSDVPRPTQEVGRGPWDQSIPSHTISAIPPSCACHKPQRPRHRVAIQQKPSGLNRASIRLLSTVASQCSNQVAINCNRVAIKWQSSSNHIAIKSRNQQAIKGRPDQQHPRKQPGGLWRIHSQSL